MKPITYLLIHALLAPAPAGLPQKQALELKLSGLPLQLQAGQRVSAHGRIAGGFAGLRVVLQRKQDGVWLPVARATTRTGGAFALRFPAPPTGSWAVRLKVGSNGALTARRLGRCSPFCSEAGGAAPGKQRLLARLGVMEVFRPAVASWYGGGGPLACGGWLTPQTLGVANRTLPCGTVVTLRYGSRTVRVPVVDRGPFVSGREFDLTEATKQALGFPGLGVVWTTAN